MAMIDPDLATQLGGRGADLTGHHYTASGMAPS